MLLTIVWRTMLAGRTPVPSEDGVSYLWMAQQFAAGEFAAGLSEVFPPGLPLLLAPMLVCGGDPFVAAQVFCIACAALTLWPLADIARRLQPGSEGIVVLLWASASLLARNSVEVFSEPPFLLAMALGTRAGLQGQWTRLGAWSGVAFWLRPEGLLLAAAFVLSHRRAALRCLLPAAGSVLLLAWLRWCVGHGFDALPIHAFHERRDDLPDRGDLLANVLDVPKHWLQGLGPVGALALLAVRSRRDRTTHALAWQILLQIVVICTFVVRQRFFLSCAVPVFVLAALGLASLPVRWRWSLIAASMAIGLFGAWHGLIDQDRLAERQLGEHLAKRLRPDETVTGNLTRLVWYAGRRPLPPRHFTAEQLLVMATDPAVRFFACATRRDSFADLQVGLWRDFVPMQLPAAIESMANDRGIAVFERR